MGRLSKGILVKFRADADLKMFWNLNMLPAPALSVEKESHTVEQEIWASPLTNNWQKQGHLGTIRLKAKHKKHKLNNWGQTLRGR